LETNDIGYKLIKKIKDEKFDVDNLHQYILLLNIGVRDLQVGVVDDSSGKCLLLEDYVFNVISSYEELLEVLNTLFESHHLLMAGFWKEVRASFKNHKFIQVPESLFLEEAASDYIRFNAKLDEEKELVASYEGNQTDAVTVFTVPKNIHQWLFDLYPSTKLIIVHQAAAIIESALAYLGANHAAPMYIYVDRFRLHILVLRNKKLIYYNQFAIKQFADYIKYIMLVMKGLKMNQQTSEVVIWGYLGKNSSHYNEFYKYIKNVVFGERAKFLSFGYMFDEIQDHHFMDLYGIYLCKTKVEID
jgi:hypothetical protein